MYNFEKYKQLKELGLAPQGAYLKAKKEGVNTINATRMLREIYGLDLVKAKEEIVKFESNGITLSEYQKSLLPELKNAFNN